MPKGTAGPGVYSATYSNIPVYEFQFGPDLKEHVMRRRQDDWINATHILKAAGFDKPARTRILEREVQKELHEKVQGGYGKYQGTWVPLEQGQNLAVRNNVFEKLRTIFEFIPGQESPPPAPKHTTNKPKAPKKPAVPKFHSKPAAAPQRVIENDFDSDALNDDETPDNTTVASESFLGDEESRYDMSQPSTGHRKRKRADPMPDIHTQNHITYSDELLDYFYLHQTNDPVARPEPPPNFDPSWKIDEDQNTALHWAAAMGDIEVVRQLKRFGADVASLNRRLETPLMRAVLFTNCQDTQAMPKMVQEFASTIDMVDQYNSTVIHHVAALSASRLKMSCARYYLDVILNKMVEVYDPEIVQALLDAQDSQGNTAIHIAAQNQARKCVRALIGRGASTDILNHEGVTAEQLIQVLNNVRRENNMHASSSPFGPESHARVSFHEPVMESNPSRLTIPHTSEAAMSIESKVTPMIIEKFQKLAESFDEELGELDKSEMEAKRLLKQCQDELLIINEQIAKFEAEEADYDEEAEEAEYQTKRDHIISLIEQQQAIRLANAVREQEQIYAQNPIYENDDTPENRLALSAMIDDYQIRRRKLVEQYVDGLANAGRGEKIEMYRKLTAKCLGIKEEGVDGQLDSILEALEDEHHVKEHQMNRSRMDVDERAYE